MSLLLYIELAICFKLALLPSIAAYEAGIKELKKEEFRSTTVRLLTLLVRCTTLCLPPDASGQSPSFFYLHAEVTSARRQVSFNLIVMRSCYCPIRVSLSEVRTTVY